MTYNTAKNILESRYTRKLCNNTYLVAQGDGGFAIRLHQTNILVIFKDGSCRLRHGGWETRITKERLNRYLPDGFEIYSHKGE